MTLKVLIVCHAACGKKRRSQGLSTTPPLEEGQQGNPLYEVSAGYLALALTFLSGFTLIRKLYF